MPRRCSSEVTCPRVSASVTTLSLSRWARPQTSSSLFRELLARLVDQSEAAKRILMDKLPSTKDTYPFTASAFDLMCDYACQDVIKSTPRNLIRTINECAIAAWDSNNNVIADDTVNEIAPIIFG